MKQRGEAKVKICLIRWSIDNDVSDRERERRDVWANRKLYAIFVATDISNFDRIKCPHAPYRTTIYTEYCKSFMRDDWKVHKSHDSMIRSDRWPAHYNEHVWENSARIHRTVLTKKYHVIGVHLPPIKLYNIWWDEKRFTIRTEKFKARSRSQCNQIMRHRFRQLIVGQPDRKKVKQFCRVTQFIVEFPLQCVFRCLSKWTCDQFDTFLASPELKTRTLGAAYFN